MERHKKLFKAKTDVTEIRSNRNQQAVELRRTRRDDIIQQKRMMLAQDDSQDELSDLREDAIRIFNSGGGPQLIEKCYSQSIIERTHALKVIRILLSARRDRPIDQMLQLNVLAALRENIVMFDYPDIQYECLWSLTNIASGSSSQANAIVDSGCLEPLVACINCRDDKNISQTAWAIGNLFGDSPKLRDEVLKCNYFELCSIVIQRVTDELTLSNIGWSLVNSCRFKTDPINLIDCEKLVKLFSILLSKNTKKTITDAIWGICYTIDACQETATVVAKSGIMSSIINYLNDPDTNIQTTVLRCLGNLSAGTDDLTGYVIQLGILNYVDMCMQSNNDQVIQETLWCLSNIAAGTKDQMRTILVPNIINYISYTLKGGLNVQRRESLWIISNIVHNGTAEDSLILLDCQIIEALVSVLKVSNVEVVKHGLDCFVAFFKVCSAYTSRIIELLEACDGVSCIEELEQHSSPAVSELAKKLRVNYIEGYSCEPSYTLEHSDFDFSNNRFNF